MKLIVVIVLLLTLLSPVWAAEGSTEQRDPTTGLTPEQLEQAQQILGDTESEDADAQLKEVMPLLGAALTGLLTQQKVDDPYVPTGDGLFDTWASAVQAQIEAGVYTTTGEPAGPLADTAFQGWQKKYGADPRFWELRYLNALAFSSNNDGAMPDGARFKSPLEILLEAHKREAVRANTLLLIWRENAAARQEARNDLRERRMKDAGLLKFNRTPQEEAQLTALQAELNDAPSSISASELNLLQQAIELAPEAAWPHYALACDLMDLGRDVEGFAELERGNSLQTGHVLPYPLPELHVTAQAGIALGSKRVSGALMLMEISCNAREPLFDCKHAWQAYFARHRQLSPMEAQAFNRFAAAQIDTSIDRVDLIQPQLLQLSLQKTVLDSWDLTPAQRDVLLRVHGAKEEFTHLLYGSEEPDSAQQLIYSTLAHGENGVYLAGWDLLQHSVSELQLGKPILAHMAMLDYTNIQLTPELAKYPPVRRVDLRAKSLAHHVQSAVTYLIPKTPSETWNFEPTRDKSLRLMQFLDQAAQKIGK